MRNQFKTLLLLLRSVTRSSFRNPATTTPHLQKVHRNLYILSSFLGTNVDKNTFNSILTNPKFRSFSTETDVNKENGNDTLLDILSKSTTNDEINTGLESIKLSLSTETVSNRLKNLQGGNPELAWKFFSFVLDTDSEKLSPTSYNLMLVMLGTKEYREKLLGLLTMMKKKGYRVKKVTYQLLTEKLVKENMVDVLDEVKKLCGSETYGTSAEDGKMCTDIFKVINANDWGEEVENKLRSLECNWSNEIIAVVIERLRLSRLKALKFFSWVEENSFVKHNELSYNAMLDVLACEDCMERFWQITVEMKKAGFQMDLELYRLIVGRLVKREMSKDAVDLYEFVMGGKTKPAVRDFDILLQKVVTSKDLDVDLLSRAMKIFTDGGNSLTESTHEFVANSLSAVGKRQECGKILKAMLKGGLEPTNGVYNKTIFCLGAAGKSAEATQVLYEMEGSGCKPDSMTWTSLIRGQCVAHDLEKALSSFHSLVEKFGFANASSAFKALIWEFCHEKRAKDAFKLLSEMVEGTELKPSNATYRRLIGNLLRQEGFNEALHLVGLMKFNNHTVPSVNGFIDHISKSGTETDAMSFLSAVSDEKVPSPFVYVRMFQAFFNAGRHSEAEKCFTMSPTYIRSNADVLNLFRDQKPEASAVAA